MIVPINVKDDRTTLEHLLHIDQTGTDQDHPSRCEACGVNATKTRSRRIGEHPDVLCIMLQRNNYVNLQRTERINTAVDFPIIGLNPNGEDDADNRPTTYDLIGGVFHKKWMARWHTLQRY